MIKGLGKSPEQEWPNAEYAENAGNHEKSLALRVLCCSAFRPLQADGQTKEPPAAWLRLMVGGTRAGFSRQVAGEVLDTEF